MFVLEKMKDKLINCHAKFQPHTALQTKVMWISSFSVDFFKHFQRQSAKKVLEHFDFSEQKMFPLSPRAMLILTMSSAGTSSFPTLIDGERGRVGGRARYVLSIDIRYTAISSMLHVQQHFDSKLDKCSKYFFRRLSLEVLKKID